MTEQRILSTNIRFPVENLPQEVDDTNVPVWIQTEEVYYDDETRKYKIKRLNGESAGDQTSPVYMDEQGQPRPITGFNSSLLDNIEQELDIENRINRASAVTISEDSPFLNVTKTDNNFVLQESLSDFLTYTPSDNLSIIKDSYKIHDVPEGTWNVVVGKQAVSGKKTMPVIRFFSGAAIDFYNANPIRLELDPAVEVVPEDIRIIATKHDENGLIIKALDMETAVTYRDSGNTFYGPHSILDPDAWGNQFSTQSEIPAFEIENNLLYFYAVSAVLSKLEVTDDNDLISVYFYYSETNEVNYKANAYEEITANQTIPTTTSLTIGFRKDGSYIAPNTFTLGEGLIGDNYDQLVVGRYNTTDTNYSIIVGNGKNDTERKNVFTVDRNGNVMLDGRITDATGNQYGTVHIGADAPSEDSNAVIWITE